MKLVHTDNNIKCLFISSLDSTMHIFFIIFLFLQLLYCPVWPYLIRPVQNIGNIMKDVDFQNIGVDGIIFIRTVYNTIAIQTSIFSIGYRY